VGHPSLQRFKAIKKQDPWLLRNIVAGTLSPLNAILLQTKTLYYAQQKFMRSTVRKPVSFVGLIRISCT